MASLRWCCKQKDGIKLAEPNDNLAKGYIKMAENSIGTMTREKNYNISFSISACYYSMYYSLYSVLMKSGIKCEIHSCTIEIMDKLLKKFYSDKDIAIIKKAFKLRGIAQCYVDRIISKEDSDFIISQAPLFFNKSKEILSRINQKDVDEIKEKIKEFL